MSDWSSRKQHHASPSSTYLHRNQHHNQSCSVSPFGQHHSPHHPSSHDHHRSAPFSSFPSRTEDIDEVDECCSYIGKLLLNEPSAHHQQHRSAQQQQYPQHSRHSESQSKFGSSPGKAGTMTIGHHHYNRHHYPYHDHYHDDSPLLPRIEFPASQFDRLLRGSASNLDRHTHQHSSDTSNRFTSSTRDSSSTTSLSSSSSSSSSSPFSSSNSSSRHSSSWKSGGPFDNRKK